MKTIKFSHQYGKLNGMGKQAVLLDVLTIKLEEMSKVFLDFDTDNGLFPLPKRGNYLLLLFKGDAGIFPTLRAAFPGTKVDYYRKAIGETFEIFTPKS